MHPCHIEETLQSCGHSGHGRSEGCGGREDRRVQWTAGPPPHIQCLGCIYPCFKMASSSCWITLYLLAKGNKKLQGEWAPDPSRTMHDAVCEPRTGLWVSLLWTVGRQVFSSFLFALLTSPVSSCTFALSQLLQGDAGITMGSVTLFHCVEMRQTPARSTTSSQRGSKELFSSPRRLPSSSTKTDAVWHLSKCF